MKKQFFISSIVFVGFIFFLFWFFSKVSHEILLGLFAGLTPSGVLWYLQNRKDEKEHHNWLLRNKEAYLTEMVDVFISLLHDKKSSAEKKAEKLEKRLLRLQPALFVWGTPVVIHAWNQMQLNIKDSNDLDNVIRNGERFFRSIRKELGHDDSLLKPGELWAALLRPGDKQRALDACKGETYE